MTDTKIQNYLWLDDERPLPFSKAGPVKWFLAKNYNEAVKIIAENDIDVAFLDHDLAIEHYLSNDTSEFREKTGYDVVLWMEKHDKFPSQFCYVHSANPVGSLKMCIVLARHYNTKRNPYVHYVSYSTLMEAYRKL